jgi:hypothetical protein
MEATQASARGAADAPDDGLTVATDPPHTTRPTTDPPAPAPPAGLRVDLDVEQDQEADESAGADHQDTPADTELDDDADDEAATTELDDLDDFDDLFAEFLDELPNTGGAARQEYLSIRGFTRVRQVLVQHIKGSPTRPSTLGELVSARQPRALLLYLLLLACELRLSSNRRLPLTTVARMLTTANYPCSPRQARLAIQALVTRHLVRASWSGASVELVPLVENGSGTVWDAPIGDDEDPDLQRYFTLPNDFFSDEVLDQLHLPGIAVLLVGLKETSQTAVFSISVERFAQWYGFSERTAERGYRELATAKLMRTHRQFKKDSRMVKGVKSVYHRTLLGEFATQSRRDAQGLARAARGAVAAKTKARPHTVMTTTTDIAAPATVTT